MISRSTCGVALAFAGSILGLAAGAGADSISYAFAEQTISGVTVSGATVGALKTGTDSAATLGGSGIAFSDPTDAAEAFLGAAPPAPQNFFMRYAPSLAAASALGTFIRGDTAVSPVISLSVVAESYLNGNSSPGSGHGGLDLTAPLTLSSSGPVTFSWNYLNDADVATSNGGSAQAVFKFNLTIKDITGNVVFSNSPSALNLGVGSPPNGGEIHGSGSMSITSGTLTPGTYSATLSESADSFVSVPSPVPAPAAAWGGLGLLSMLAARLGLGRDRNEECFAARSRG